MTRASVFQIVNIGVETTKGTAVAANKRVTAEQFAITPRPEIQTYRASGYRWPTIAALNKEWTEVSISGPLTYTSIIYWLSSALKTVSASGAGTAKTWAFDMSTTSANTTKAYTVELGDAERALEFAYGQVNSIGMRFTRDGAELVNTSMMGKAISDNITLTSSPTELTLKPVLPTQVAVYVADTQAGLAGASAVTPLSVEWSVQNILGSLFTLNGSSSWSADVPLEPNSTVSLLTEANAEGMAHLANIRSGVTKFLRVKAIGDLITGSDYYMLQTDLALKFTNISELRDEQGVFAVNYEAQITHDSTWGKGIAVTVVNELSTL